VTQLGELRRQFLVDLLGRSTPLLMGPKSPPESAQKAAPTGAIWEIF
jgi:hypothetical protein